MKNLSEAAAARLQTVHNCATGGAGYFRVEAMDFVASTHEPDAPTQELPRAEPGRPTPAQAAGAGAPPIPLVAGSREQCSACGAPLAADQRYCVECGQRRTGAAAPFSGQAVGAPAQAQPTAPAHARRPLLSINATLLAGIGTLLLAMGIGILIGRSSQSASKAPAVQLLASPGSAGSTAAGAGAGATSEAVPGAPTSTTGAAAAKAGGSTSTPKPVPKKSRPPAPKAVKVGAKGSGPGYQKGKFTGNFFGEEEK